jgi:hypothetical protein
MLWLFGLTTIQFFIKAFLVKIKDAIKPKISKADPYRNPKPHAGERGIPPGKEEADPIFGN